MTQDQKLEIILLPQKREKEMEFLRHQSNISNFLIIISSVELRNSNITFNDSVRELNVSPTIQNLMSLSSMGMTWFICIPTFMRRRRMSINYSINNRSVLAKKIKISPLFYFHLFHKN